MGQRGMGESRTAGAAWLIRGAAVFTACVLLSPALLAQSPPPGVFSEVRTAVVSEPGAALEPATARSRVVQVDTRKITAARRGREVLRLNLFDDAVVEVEINRVRPTQSGYFISGSPKGMAWGEVRLVVNGPVMVGTVETPEGKFTIRSAGSGRHVIREIDPSKERFECELEDAPALKAPAWPNRPAISSIGPPLAQSFSPHVNQTEEMPTEDGSEVRVLVVYTPTMQAQQGGVAGMRAAIDLLIQSTNQAFEDSGINPRLVLAHAALVDWDAESLRTQELLRRLRTPDDGHADEVHALRNEYAADLVHLLAVWPGNGLAYGTNSEDLSQENTAFALSGHISERTFAHETGHNLGLIHDRYVPGRGVYPYAYGYVNKKAFEPGAASTAAWRTIMAYGQRCRVAGIVCPGVFRFSNPDQTHIGDPLGVPAESAVTGPDGPADARLTINNMARWVGSYRSEACTDFSLSTDAIYAGVEGGAVVIQVDTAPGCLWQASSQSDFLRIASDLPAAGPGNLVVELSPNQSGEERNGSLTVAGQTLSVRQLATDAGVCGRTFAVAEAIAESAGYPGIAECEEVTDADLAKVEFLDLRNRSISSLKAGDFARLPGLQSLNVESNRLTELPDGLFAGLSSLESLNLRENNLAGLPAGVLGDLVNLQELDLSANDLTFLPENLLGDLKNLQQLGLSSNRLADLSAAAFAGLSQLENLDLDRNNLSALPRGLFTGLINLEGLDLSWNRLFELPERFFAGLSGLETLLLRSNRLSVVSDSLLADLPGLRRLDLAENQIRTVSTDAFAGLSNLEELQLHSNNLFQLPKAVFSDLGNLRQLGLGRNPLEEVPLELFDGLVNLRVLNLDWNRLTSLRSEAFAGLAALETLYLSTNRLSTLPEDFFSSLPALENLYLDNNQLRTLPDKFFSGLTGLERLDFRFNPGYPLPLHLSLEKVQQSQFKAVARAGAPFELRLPVSVSSGGSIDGDVSTITIPVGAVESAPIAITRVDGTQEAVSVDLATLPELPADHEGYVLAKDEALPLRILPSLLPADAMLIDLAVSGAALDPPFGAGDGSYAVLVANEVTTVTVSPLASNAKATVAYLDENDNALKDADLVMYGHQVNLDVGVNTIQLSVTSEDATATQAYSLSITRDGSMNVCVRTPQIRDAIVESVLEVDTCAEITQEHLSGIERLYVSVSGIEILKSGDFAGLTGLIDLDLGANLLTGLPADVFVGLEALEVLRIAVNQITNLPKNVFSGLPSLQHLSLGGNKLSALPAEIFTDLSNLETLQLYNNRLSDLPKHVFSDLSALQELDLGGNPLVAVTADTFSGLSALQILRLSDTRIESLPTGIFSDLSALRELHLSGNALRSLEPDVFSALGQLEFLRLRNNRLSELPDGLFSGLSAVRTLNLARNDIENLHEKLFSHQTRLERLELDGNRMTSLPDGIFSGLISLQELTLEENVVDPLPLSISLQKVSDGEFKAVAPTGAPFTLSLRYNISKTGTSEDDLSLITIPVGLTESRPLEVRRVADTMEAVTVDIGELPPLPDGHSGYSFQKDESLPRVILSGLKDSPPAQVTRVLVTAGAEQLEVSWKAVSGADGYKVQWKSGDEDYAEDRQVALLGGETTNYTIIDLTVDTEYTIRVIATRDHADDGEPSDEVTGTPASPDPDVNADGTLDGDDAQVMYQAYASDEKVGDGETGGTAESRRTLLSGLAGTADPSDDDLKAMLRKANVWRSVGVAHGGDINEDGAIDGDDAFVMYYAYEFADLVGNGETGGTARHRQHLLASRAGKDDPSDEDLKRMLRRANKLKEDFG